MTHQYIDSKFSKAPILFAVAQITFNPIPDLSERIADIKKALTGTDLVVFEAKTKNSLTMRVDANLASAEPLISNYWTFRNKTAQKLLQLTQNSVVIYTTNYTTFADFLDLINSVMASFTSVVTEVNYMKTIGLRFFNGSISEIEGASILSKNITGVELDGIQTDHFHHNYNFWCITDESSKLVLNANSLHGTQLNPIELIQNQLEIDQKFLFQYDDDVVRIDIHETKEFKNITELTMDNIEHELERMRLNLKTLFLNSTTNAAQLSWGRNNGAND